jgi:ABC-type phosphate/phosphonate transport system substrate-binding protein
MVEAGFHQEALRMVADGRVDGAAIDCQVLDIELRHRPELEGAVRRIGSIGPSTIQPVVASRSRLDRAERATITEILLRTHQDPDARRLLDRALVDRFVPVDEQSYDDIRHMLATVRGAGLLPDWWDERWQRIQDA